jgi:hypothetical protein
LQTKTGSCMSGSINSTALEVILGRRWKGFAELVFDSTRV